MEGILEKISMLGHKSMLIIDGNSLRFDESSSDGIPRFNAGIEAPFDASGLTGVIVAR